MPVFGSIGPYIVGEDISLTALVTVDGTLTGTPINVTGWGGTMTLWRRREDVTPAFTGAFTVPVGTDGKLLGPLMPHATTTTFDDRMYIVEFRRTDSGNNACVDEYNITFVA